MLRVVSWNCRRASATHALWRYLADLAPDVAVLQEVNSLPQDLLHAYDSRITVPVGKTGKPQRFRSVLLVRVIDGAEAQKERVQLAREMNQRLTTVGVSLDDAVFKEFSCQAPQSAG